MPNPITLSRVERLILANQYKILALVDRGNAAEYERAQEILENGYEISYENIAAHVYEDTFTTEQAREVYDILDMFSALRRSYAGLKDTSGIDESDIQFAGFDGNNETEQMAYTRFLIHKEQRWTDLAQGPHDDFNSHFPSIDRYRAMVRRWSESADPHRLTAEDLKRIVGR